MVKISGQGFAVIGAWVFASAAVVSAGWVGIPALRGATEEAGMGVLVLGPEAFTVWNGTVHGGNMTALRALEAAAVLGPFEVVTEEYSFGVFVQSIGGFNGTENAGWIYNVDRRSERILPSVGADKFPIEVGDTVRWTWESFAG